MSGRKRLPVYFAGGPRDGQLIPDEGRLDNLVLGQEVTILHQGLHLRYRLEEEPDGRRVARYVDEDSKE